jgi:NitT/TauT family transport system permease protein
VDTSIKAGRLRNLASKDMSTAALSLLVAVLLWELGSRSQALSGLVVPWISAVPAPSSVLRAWWGLIDDPGYWQSWYLSSIRVLTGFLAGLLLGVPFGLLLVISRTFNGIVYPTFEMLRPIPPLAWVPAAIVFWPTTEMSIAFITFLGAFYTIAINTLEGGRSIDPRYVESALSMGASRWNVFRRIIFPGTLPSITTGAAVGMGITWEVVVAAEMISGGGSSMGGSGSGTGGGLGFFIWNSYTGGSYEQIVVGMLSIGIAGYVSSALLRRIGGAATPWLQKRYHVGVQVTTGGAFIELREVSKAYGSRNNETQVVHDCSLNVDPGKLTVMIGPSGCGKSTLARLIAGFERPSSGKVLCDGKPVVGPSKDRLVLFQETALYPWMTTLQNVLYGPNARGEPKAPSLRAARELIERVGLEPF